MQLKKINNHSIHWTGAIVCFALFCSLLSCRGVKGTTKDVKMLTLLAPGHTKLSGCWRVDSVYADSIFTPAETHQIILLEDAEAACYIGGEWFIGKNAEGWYTLPAGQCLAGQRTIQWNILKHGNRYFLAFLRQNGPKGVLVAKYTTYTIEIAQISKTSMLFKYPVEHDNKRADVYLLLHKK